MPAALCLIAMSIIYAVLGVASPGTATTLAGPFVVIALAWPLLSARRRRPAQRRR